MTILGNHLRVAILINLRTEGPATRTEIARRIGTSADHVRFHLNALEDDGIVTVYPSRQEPDVRSRRYHLDSGQLDELVARLACSLTSN